MRMHICQKCNFQFTEADKFWDAFQADHKCPNCEVRESSKTSSGSRLVVAILSWGFSSVAVISSVMFFLVGLTGSYLALIPLVAWVSLGFMTVYWLKNERCDSLWPIVGTLAGIPSAILFHESFVIYISAVPLAIYLVFWHMQSHKEP